MPTPPDDRRITVPWSLSNRRSARVLAQPLQQFLDTEASSGIVLLVAALAAVVWASSPWLDSYTRLWSTELTIGAGSLQLTETLQYWVNDLAMALFFFVVGLEIKRELVHGDLRSARTATLPIVCAVGGMILPALLYLCINAGGPGSKGWGIPMATDIAFSIGVLAVIGRRAPVSLKVFLLTLAIVDDIGAIVVIALFYSNGIQLLWLGFGALVVGAVLGIQRLGVRSLVPYTVLAGLLWLTMFESGVHATIAGVVLGLITPAHPLQNPSTVRIVTGERLRSTHLDDGVEDERDETTMLEVSSLTTQAVSPLARLERRLHPWSSFVVLPLFALANAGVDLTPDHAGPTLLSRISIGVIVGLVIGKPLGIVLAALIVTRWRSVSLPAGAGWLEMVGVGMLAGIGFTVSLFITGLAFDGVHAEEAKLAILVGSVVAGLLGALLLALRDNSRGDRH